MSKYRIDKLNQLPGWTWENKSVKISVESWDRKYTLLIEFIAKEGRFPKSTEKVDGVVLRSWINSNRCLRKKGELKKEREIKFEAIPGWEW